MNVAINKTARIAAALAALFLIVFACSAAQRMTSPRQALPTPSALPFSDERAIACLSLFRGGSTATSTSILLVQVTKTEPGPEPGIQRKPVTESDIPKVRSARLAVVERLAGPSVPEELTLVNPVEHEPVGMMSNGDFTLTRRMRPGEYWLLLYDPAAGRFYLDASQGTTRLSGLSDLALALLRRHRRLVTASDQMAAFRDIRQIVLNAKESPLSRRAAFLSVWSLNDRDSRWWDNPRSPFYAATQSLIVEMVKQPNLPRELGARALDAMQLNPDKPLAPGSDDVFKLRFLLRMLFDEDAQTAAKAGERLYYMSTKSGAENGRPVVYYYPDIIAALEARDAQDQRQGRPRIGQGVLNNLELAHRRNMPEIQKDHTVVVRRLP